MIAIARPVTELPPGSALRFALTWQVGGLALLVAHILLVKQSVMLLPVVLMIIGWLYYNAPLAGLMVYFQFLIYQNWTIGLFSDDIARNPTFTMLQGSNFAVLAMLAAIGWSRLMLPPWRRVLAPAIMITSVAMVLALLYTGFGSIKEGPTSASIYFRNTTALVLATIVGLDVGRVWGYRTIAICFLMTISLNLGLGIVEFFAPVTYYEVTNAVPFMILKNEGTRLDTMYTASDVANANTTSLFNSGQAAEQIRVMGTMMHPISNAYVLALFGVVAWSIKRGFWLFLIIPMLILSGVKGAALMFVWTMSLWFVWQGTKNRPFLLGCGLALIVAYVGYGLAFGLKNGDWHVIGFMGGVHGFISNPLGHGIGVGGNLSASTSLRASDWEKFQHAASADFALESAVGVLLYQMGIAAAAVIGVFVTLVKLAPFGRIVPRYGVVPKRTDIMFIALTAVAANGIFQEEAYSYAATMLTLLCGVLVVNGRREVEAVSMTKLLKLATNRG